MESTDNPSTPVWAVIELMGHVRYGGLVSRDSQLGTGMLRCEVPTKNGLVTQFINPSSIYRLTICSEAIARLAAAAGDPSPLRAWELSGINSLPETSGGDDEEPAWQDPPENED
jgi:hypothetical protein